MIDQELVSETRALVGRVSGSDEKCTRLQAVLALPLPPRTASKLDLAWPPWSAVETRFNVTSNSCLQGWTMRASGVT